MNFNITLHPDFEKLYQDYINEGKEEFLSIEGISRSKVDIGNMSYDFFNKKLSNIAIDANSNVTGGINPTTYRTFITDGAIKLLGYHLWWYHSMKRYGTEFANKAIRMIWDGDLYLHDAHGVKSQMPYCYAFSLASLVIDGRPYGRMPNTPAKRRRTFISHVDKLIGDLSKQFAGATAPSDFFLWYAYFCKLDNLDLNNQDHINDILQDYQSLVFLFNEPSRAEGESPFVNMSMYDYSGLNELFKHVVYPDFSQPDIEYVMELQKIFIEYFRKGNPLDGFPYSFPVVTMNITTNDNGDFIDNEFAMYCAEVDRELANFNLHFGPKSKMAMCCRYENDLDDMEMSPDSFGNGGVNIGSHRLVTPNLPRAAKKADYDIGLFYQYVDELFDISAKLLDVHRQDILQKRIDENPDFLQFFGRLKWFSLDTMFSTFGIVGINEVCEYFGLDIIDEDGTDFVLDLTSYIKNKIRYYKREYGVPFNAEEIPGEQACVSLVKKDKLHFGEDEVPYDLYSNQYIPLTKNVDLLTRLELSGRFMRKISGGGIVHANIDHTIDSKEKVFEIMKFAAKCGVNHIAICYRFGKCLHHNASVVGQSNNCPICGDPIIRAKARVIGYFSDEDNWNEVRRTKDAPNRKYVEY